MPGQGWRAPSWKVMGSVCIVCWWCRENREGREEERRGQPGKRKEEIKREKKSFVKLIASRYSQKTSSREGQATGFHSLFPEELLPHKPRHRSRFNVEVVSHSKPNYSFKTNISLFSEYLAVRPAACPGETRDAQTGPETSCLSTATRHPSQHSTTRQHCLHTGLLGLG